VILVFDALVLGGSHVPFNAALLRVMRLAYPEEDILMCGTGSHIAVLAREQGMQRLRFESLVEEAAEQTGGHLNRLIETEKPDNIVVCGCTAEQLRSIRKIALKHRDISFDAIMHSELAEPAHWRSRNPLTRRNDMFGTIARGFPDNMRLVVLEYAIEASLRKLVRRGQTTAVFPHPLPLNEHRSAEPAQDRGNRQSISFIGGTFAAKGFEAFVEIARTHRDTFDFQVIGERTNGYSSENDRLFSMPPSNGKLERAMFDRALQTTDLICMPLDPVRYSWIASGTLLDAIAFDRPVLATRTAVTTDWEQRYGRFGFLADDVQDMVRLIQVMRSQTIDIALNEEQRAARAAISADRAELTLAQKFVLHGRAVS
jgi:hypothetical protein